MPKGPSRLGPPVGLSGPHPVRSEAEVRQWCKHNEGTLRGKEVDARKLFEEAQAPKCKACGKP